jgi:hypothetical protein
MADSGDGRSGDVGGGAGGIGGGAPDVKVGEDGGSRVKRANALSLGAPYLVPAALALAAALAAWLGRGRLASWGAAVEGPERTIPRALAGQTRAHLADVYGFRAGGTVELFDLRFGDVVPSVEGRRATVVAMVTARGRVAWREERAALEYVGRERFHMEPCTIAAWCGEGDEFDQLRGVLLALFRRHDAFARRDLPSYERLLAEDYHDGAEDRARVVRRLARELSGPPARARVVGWQIRVERDAAHVGEDLEVRPEGGAPRHERHVYRLARVGERWVFTAGL